MSRDRCQPMATVVQI